jgi:hypothetical protein
MKRFLFFAWMAITCLAVEAQTIQNNSKWWDGSVLYTATVQGNNVKMEGVGAHEGGFRFHLTKLAQKQGEYVLSGEDYEAEALRAKVGWRVQYVRKDGMYFLAVRNPNGTAVWKMTLTPDNLENSLAQERHAEEKPVSDMLSNWLMNTTYLGRFSKPQLRLMRNEILARHGYVFQAKDLQEYFSRQSWYKPCTDNAAIALSVIEQLNIELIKSEEAVPDDIRGYGMSGEMQAKEGTPVKGENVLVVRNEAEFIEALGSDRTISVDYDVHLNLSRILENMEDFVNVKGRRWTDDASTVVSTQPMILSESCFDGRQLTLKNFKNLVIRGAYSSSIEVEPRYAYCLNFVNCSGIVVENLTIGHTEGGYCDGGVIAFEGGRRNVIRDCDLYGCGTYGITTRETNSLSVYDTNIHHCTYGIMELYSSQAVKFFNCDFFNNKEYSLVEAHGCEDIVFSGCRFYNNQGSLFQTDSEIMLLGCEIYHSNMGTTDFISEPKKDNKYAGDLEGVNLPVRNTGPDSK